MREIEQIAGPNYEDWYIGITDDPKRRKREHERENRDTSAWRDWNAESTKRADYIEWYFVELGMRGGGGGGNYNSTHVYIF